MLVDTIPFFLFLFRDGKPTFRLLLSPIIDVECWCEVPFTLQGKCLLRTHTICLTYLLSMRIAYSSNSSSIRSSGLIITSSSILSYRLYPSQLSWSKCSTALTDGPGPFHPFWDLDCSYICARRSSSRNDTTRQQQMRTHRLRPLF